MSPDDLQRELDKLVSRHEVAQIVNRAVCSLTRPHWDRWLAPVYRIGVQRERFYRGDVVERLALRLAGRRVADAVDTAAILCRRSYRRSATTSTSACGPQCPREQIGADTSRGTS